MKQKTSLVIEYIWYLPGLDHYVAISAPCCKLHMELPIYFCILCEKKEVYLLFVF